MNHYTVTAHKIPTNYHEPRCFVVEAASEDDDDIKSLAIALVERFTTITETP